MKSILFILFMINYHFLLGQNSEGNAIIAINNDSDSTGIYSSFLLDSAPEYPGGKDSLEAFIIKNIYQKLGNINYEGVITIRFTVRSDGTIRSIKILESDSKFLENLILECFKKMQKWKPGKLKSKYVNSIICYPFVFRN